MKTGVLFGENEDSDEDKKLNRITTSFDDETFRFIDDIAKSKGYSHSKVVNILCKSVYDDVVKQSEIIVKNPLAVAFDLVTK